MDHSVLGHEKQSWQSLATIGVQELGELICVAAGEGMVRFSGSAQVTMYLCASYGIDRQ
ncbi:hypothetical protein CISG_02293 [Coccidioides immitis RMSCC 3703]|uniref:Uncharacterized protein n=2 Tax=Coccidioides immitis TaxID=5501 RepID=A0A0J8U1U1_COCIT|nr:hypothetical protein CIRG_06036 [Coccidioides immitis RMSCC 2394]KMU80442.1 hypothetical protein CISG_02293 [Coccidioides immitis RMSCC 3703]